jgi:hypothetical protein
MARGFCVSSRPGSPGEVPSETAKKEEKLQALCVPQSGLELVHSIPRNLFLETWLIKNLPAVAKPHKSHERLPAVARPKLHNLFLFRPPQF